MSFWNMTNDIYRGNPCCGLSQILMVYNRSWHLPGDPKQVGTLIKKEGGCVDLAMDTLHLKYPLVLFGSEGYALTLLLLLLSPRVIVLCHCSSTMTKDHFLMIFYGTK